MMPQYAMPMGQPMGYPQMAPMAMQPQMMPMVMQPAMPMIPQPQPYMALQETYPPASPAAAAVPTINMKVTPKSGQAGLDGHGQQPYNYNIPVTVDAGYDLAQLDDIYAKQPPAIDASRLGKQGKKAGAPAQLSVPPPPKPGKYPKAKMSPFEKAERKRATTEQKRGIRSFGLGSDFNEAPTDMPKQAEKQEIDFEDFWDDDYDWTASALHKDVAANSQPMQADDIYFDYEPVDADLDLAASHAHLHEHDPRPGYDARPIDLTEHEEHDLASGDAYFSQHAAERFAAYDLIH